MAQETARRSRKVSKPVIAGLIVISGLVAAVYFRGELWKGVTWTGRWFADWLTEWAPAHKGQAAAIIAFTVFALVVNYIAHRQGRFGAWIFAVIVEVGLWALFWFRTFIPSFNELIGLNIERLSIITVVVSAVIVVAITGVVFWTLELREIWKTHRAR